MSIEVRYIEGKVPKKSMVFDLEKAYDQQRNVARIKLSRSAYALFSKLNGVWHYCSGFGGIELTDGNVIKVDSFDLEFRNGGKKA